MNISNELMYLSLENDQSKDILSKAEYAEPIITNTKTAIVSNKYISYQDQRDVELQAG